MKVLTKEEEREHYNATIQGGILGGGLGLAFGGLAVYGASRRFHTFNQLTLQFKAFLGLSGGTFGSIIAADRASRRFDEEHNPEKKRFAQELEDRREAEHRGKGTLQLAREWAEENRYPIVFGSWVASMGIAFGLVSRNRYLSGQQKLVQARVYAQGLTLAVLLASFAMEGSDAARGKGRWETIKVLDPNDPTHSHLIEKQVHKERYAGEDQWMEMVEAEERKIKEREQAIKDQEAKDKKAGKAKNVKHEGEMHKKQKPAEEKVEEKKNLVP